MNYRTQQVIERTVKRFTAFPSFAELIRCSIEHGYTPTIIGWRGHCSSNRLRIRHLAQAFDDHLEALGIDRKCYRGHDA